MVKLEERKRIKKNIWRKYRGNIEVTTAKISDKCIKRIHTYY